MRLTVKVKIILLCGLFLVVFISLTTFLLWNLRNVVGNFRGAVHISQDMLKESQLLQKLVVDMETGQRGFIITGQDEFLEPYRIARTDFKDVIEDLREDLHDRPEHLGTLEKIEHLQLKWVGFAGEPEIRLRRLIGKTEINLKAINQIVLGGTGKRILDNIRGVAKVMQEDFRKNSQKDELILIIEIIKSVVDAETGQRGFLLAGKDRFLEPYYQGQILFHNNVKMLKGLLEDESNLERLANVEKLFAEWINQAATPEIAARVKYEKDPRSMTDLAAILGKGIGKGIIDELRVVTSQFIAQLETETNVRLSLAEKSATFAVMVSVMVSLTGIVLIAFLSVLIARSIIRPVNLLLQGTQAIAKGDLNYKVRLKSKDELGTLADAFNQMTEDLQKTTVSRNYVDNIVNSMSDSLIVIAPDGKIQTVNTAICDLLGYKEEELIRQPFKAVIAEEETIFKGTQLQKLIEVGSIRDYEMTYRTKSGEHIPVSFSGSAMRDPQGQLVGIVGIARDMRAAKQLAEKEKEFATQAAVAEAERKRIKELEKAYGELEITQKASLNIMEDLESQRMTLGGEVTKRKQAEDMITTIATDLARSNKELEQFAYVASHDLREPLRKVASYTQLLERRYQGKLDSDADKFIAYVVDGVTRMEELIKDLLMYSQAGRKEVSFESTDVAEVMSQTLANLSVAIRKSGATVTHGDLPTVMANPVQLGQVFQNLIGNAVKFCDKKSPRVHVSAEEKNREWIFSVRDNGVGIEPQYIDRIFVIFQRLHTRAEYPGTGIGLAICKKIVERYGGRIWLESEFGKGSTFYFTLPVK